MSNGSKPIAKSSIASSGVVGLSALVQYPTEGKAEDNPYTLYIPDSVRETNEDLFDYLDEQASILREQHESRLDGQTNRTFLDLTTTYAEETFALGTQATFTDPAFGTVLACFVRFQTMTASAIGAPVGRTADETDSIWDVTNTYEQSSNGAIIGMLPQPQVPSAGSYGWIVVAGPNVQPVALADNETSTLGTELGWGATGILTSSFTGMRLGYQTVVASITAAYAAGQLYISPASSVGTEGDALLQQEIDALEVRTDAAEASITTLQQVSVTQADAIAQQQLTLQASIDENTARISRERTTRITNEEAFAASIETLSAEVSGNSASIVTEAQTRARADSANASLITNLEAYVTGEFETVQESLAIARNGLDVLVNDREAISQSFTDLTASLITAQGDIVANASALTALDARVTTNEGSITANASSITALDTRLTTAEGNITGNASAISSLDTRVTTAEGSITSNASAITSLDTRLTSAEGSITGNASAITSLDTRVTSAEGSITSNASAITTLSARVTTAEGDIVANASDITTVTASLDAVEARRKIQVNANGVITGIELISGTGGLSQVHIQADVFKVTNSTGTGDVPFEIVGGVTYIKNAVIQDGSIGADKLNVALEESVTELLSKNTATLSTGTSWQNWTAGESTNYSTQTAGHAEMHIYGSLSGVIEVTNGSFDVEFRVINGAGAAITAAGTLVITGPDGITGTPSEPEGWFVQVAGSLLWPWDSYLRYRPQFRLIAKPSGTLNAPATISSSGATTAAKLIRVLN